MRITKFKKTINRLRHIFTYNPDTGFYHSDREDDFTYRLESFFRMDYVELYGIQRDDGQEFIVNETILEGNDMVDAILIDEDHDEKTIYLRTENGDDVNLDEAVISTQRVTSNNLDTIEQAIITNNSRAIRLERLLRNRRETPLEFLKKFFIGTGDVEAWNETRNTIYVDDETVQTDAGRRRSMGDIYMILKYYYPSITLREVVKLLYVDLWVGNTGMRSSNCSLINKRVWYFEEGRGSFMEATQRDEYGNAKAFYVEQVRQ